MSHPEQNQIEDWQSQWNATKAMYQSEIDFMIKTVTDKQNEFDGIRNSSQWATMKLQERVDLRNAVTLARTELKQIQDELSYAKQEFIAVNPQAEHYVQF